MEKIKKMEFTEKELSLICIAITESLLFDYALFNKLKFFDEKIGIFNKIARAMHIKEIDKEHMEMAKMLEEYLEKENELKDQYRKKLEVLRKG